MKKFICILIYICTFILLCGNVFADEVQSISCTASANENVVEIKGKIENAWEENQITLLVGSETKKIFYVDQTESDKQGNFSFTFKMKDDVPPGKYAYRVGSDSTAATFTGEIEYVGKKEYKEFVNANLNIGINGYVPSVYGTVSCPTSTKTLFNVVNVTDNKTIANDTITSADGDFDISYTLPSLLSPKRYTATISFVDGTRTLGAINIEIASSVLTVKVNGAVTVSEDVKLHAHMKSVNTSLVDKSAEITKSRSVNVEIPNIIGSTLYNLTIQGYEYRTILSPSDYVGSAEYTISGNANDEAKIVATVSNIDAFSDKMFVLEYQPTQIHPTSVFGLYKDDIVGTGQMGNLNIISCDEGRIVFSVNREIPAGQKWSGVLNVFKFKFNESYSGISKVRLSEMR